MQSMGERIKQARLAAGLSLRELAERVDVSAMALSKYENSQVLPGSDMLLRLGKALGVKVGYFLRPLQVEVQCPAFRKHSKVTKKAQGMIEGRIREFLERYLAAEDVFEPDRMPVFEWPESCSGTLKSVEEAEQWAEGLRRDWGLGHDPIANLCETLEDHGVKVILLEDVDEKFDGYSCWANETIPVVACRKGDGLPGDRQRFTLAHELGHLLLEKHMAEDVDAEKACHRFAGAFLVPAEAVRREVGSHRGRIEFKEIHSLKHKWGLSMAAWFHRLADLDIISANQYQIIARRFRASGWSKREPGEQVRPEQTQRFERLVERAVAEDIISVSRAADLLNTSLIELRGEMGWPKPEVAGV
ncbi:XRE family transcriptional regulator [bacterium]|nr:XRE family transcriptional regulator [bacterium]